MRPLRIFDINPRHIKGLAHFDAAAQVISTSHLHHLQPSAVLQDTWLAGQEAVKAGNPLIFGFIDDAGLCIDGNRLVLKTSHVFQRDGWPGRI